MGDTRRTRYDAGLADLLAHQLNVLADEWAPADRHYVRFSNTEEQGECEPQTPVDVDETLTPDMAAQIDRPVQADDVSALIARSFDYEAALWLWHFAVAPARNTRH